MARGNLPGYLASREDELQKLLSEERRNYRTLKQLTNGLQEAFIQAKNDIKSLRSEKGTLQDQINRQTVAFEKSLLAKTKEVEEIRQQMMSPLQQEMLKARMQQEMDTPLHEMCRQLEKEVEKYRSGYNQVRSECIHLQSQLEQQRKEHAHSLESQRRLHQAETSCLQKDKEELLARLQSFDLRSNEKKLEAVLKERVQLKVRLQGLEAEVAELHAQKETVRRQADGVKKQLLDSQDLGNSLEVKLESARDQLAKTQKELQLRSEENCSLCKELHEARMQVNSLSCQIENVKLSHKQEVNNMKLKFTLSQGELENEKNSLQGQTEVFQTEVELLRGEITQLKAALMEKEEEMCRKVHLVHEEGSHKTAQLQKERKCFAVVRSELEKHISQMDAAAEAQIGELQECLTKAKHQEESMSKEIKNLRTKLQQQSSQILEIERFKGGIVELQQHNEKLGEQLRKVLSSEDEQRETNKQLQETLERVREKLKSTQAQAERSQEEAQSLLQDSQKEFKEANGKLQQKYAEAKEKMKRAAVAQKERKLITEYREQKLQHKTEILEAKLEEQKLEVSLVKKNLASCEQRYERKLKNLLQAKKEFERFLFEGPCGDISYGTPFVTRPEGIFPKIPNVSRRRLSSVQWCLQSGGGWTIQRVQQQLKDIPEVSAVVNPTNHEGL